jgi:hypothetical protein
MSKWYESDDPSTVVRGASWRGVIFITAIIVFIGLVSIGLWAFSVGTSDVKGKGDAYKQKNSANNRIAAQERFHDLYNDVIRADKAIDPMKAQLDRSPNSVISQTNYTGAITYCQTAVADYNAATEKYTQRDFRDSDLPFKIDDMDPTTDCKENAQ